MTGRQDLEARALELGLVSRDEGAIERPAAHVRRRVPPVQVDEPRLGHRLDRRFVRAAAVGVPDHDHVRVVEADAQAGRDLGGLPGPLLAEVTVPTALPVDRDDHEVGEPVPAGEFHAVRGAGPGGAGAGAFRSVGAEVAVDLPPPPNGPDPIGVPRQPGQLSARSAVDGEHNVIPRPTHALLQGVEHRRDLGRFQVGVLVDRAVGPDLLQHDDVRLGSQQNVGQRCGLLGHPFALVAAAIGCAEPFDVPGDDPHGALGPDRLDLGPGGGGQQQRDGDEDQSGVWHGPPEGVRYRHQDNFD